MLSQARIVDRALAGTGACSPRLLVSGFMRSGTTWVQECMAASLSAKTVFEPLSPLEPRRRAALPPGPSEPEGTVQGAIPEPWPHDHPAWAYLARACRGGNGSRFSMTCRRSRRESLCRAAVVKDVRLQFNLAAFHDRFGVPVLHVRRDPRAVVASLLAAEWGWSYEDLSLGDVLPRSPEVWTHQAMARDEVVRRFDRDGASRIAALWAVSERFVARSLRGKPWAVQVDYEDLIADPASAFADVRGRLGLEAKAPCDFARRSASTHPARPAGPFACAAPARPAAAGHEGSRVLGIVERLHPGWGARHRGAAA